jgi:hypothetical protein
MTTLSTQYQSYKIFFLIIEVLWATKALLLPIFCLASPSLHPPALALVSMVVIVTSFHTPYSYWPPSDVTTNENHYFMWMQVKLPILCSFNCWKHVGKIIYDDFFILKPINYNNFCLMMCFHPICMMSCMFVIIFIPNINSIKQYNININNL